MFFFNDISSGNFMSKFLIIAVMKLCKSTLQISMKNKIIKSLNLTKIKQIMVAIEISSKNCF